MDIVEIIKTHLIVDIWSNDVAQNNLRNAIDDFFFDILRDQQGIELPVEVLDDIELRIMDLARAIRINDEFTASVVLARCFETQGGSLRWRIRLDTGLVPDITIAVRMDELNEAPRDYYLLPSIDMTMARLRLAERNGLSLDAYRFDTLDYFYALAGRARITEAA